MSALSRTAILSLAIVGAGALAMSCSSKSSTTSNAAACTPGADGSYVNGLYDSLSDYCMVKIQDGHVQPLSERVVPYSLATPLFSDYAVKYRTVWTPDGQSAPYTDSGQLDLPKGTIITKSFGFPVDPAAPDGAIHWVETRLLVRADSGWLATSYLWNEEQTEATNQPGGKVVPLTVTGTDGMSQHASYLVPSTTQCPKCHGTDMVKILPIGTRADQLQGTMDYGHGPESQLAHWQTEGILTGVTGMPTPLPTWNDPNSGDVNARARAYLDANCAYCHSAHGEARTTGLFLAFTETDPLRLGICKAPVAAGRASTTNSFDVVPGKPDESILIHRVEATEASIAMPEIGRSTVHHEAAALLRQWVSGLPGTCPTGK
jgi:uncharacterized repeat protein (TIGR03806 family)